MSFPAWADGRLLAPGERAVRADDTGFQLALAVFETLLLEEGRLRFVREHLARLREGARALEIRWPPPWDVERALADYVGALAGRDAAVRVTLTRGAPGAGPSLVLSARDVQRPPEPGAVVSLARARKHPEDELEAVKSTARVRNVLEREAGARRGAFEVLFLTSEGDVCEGSASNVFALTEGGLVTPGVERGCLAGVVRGKLLEDLAREPARVPLRVGRLELGALARAEEVLLTNTTGRVIPVVEVQGVVAGLPGSAGSLARELRARVLRAEERDAGR